MRPLHIVRPKFRGSRLILRLADALRSGDFEAQVLLTQLVVSKWKLLLAQYQLTRTLSKPYLDSLLPANPASWPESLKDPTAYYLNCVRYFHQKAPAFLKEHRQYFSRNRRGFGEEAFHVMWLALCKIGRPTSFLEIGVYRGQVLSLVSLLSRHFGFECLVCGVSPFSSAGDSVSRYSPSIDYWEDTQRNFQAFDLPPPKLIRGLSNSLPAIKGFSSESWDLIYIDGNHEYEVAKADFMNCAKVLRPGGRIVLDDSALGTSFQAPLFATAGHPGPSRLAREADSLGFREVLRVGHNRVFEKKS